MEYVWGRDSDTGTIRQEYYYPVIDTENLLFSLLKQEKWRRNHSMQQRGVQETTTSNSSTTGQRYSGRGLINKSRSDKDLTYRCSNCENIKEATSTQRIPGHSVAGSTNNLDIKDGNHRRDEDNDNKTNDLVFHTQKSFKKQPFALSKNTSSNGRQNSHKVSSVTNLNLCSVNINSVRAMAQRQPTLSLPVGPSLNRHQRNSTMSSTSSLSSDNSSSNSSKIRRRIVARLAKRLKDECDKILDHSESLLMDWRMLHSAIKEIHKGESRFGVEDNSASAEDAKYQDLVMFLADLFKYSPTLCITYTADANKSVSTGATGGGGGGGVVNLDRFHSIRFLELKRVSPRTVCNLNMVKRNLTTLKCIRCLDSIDEILTDPLLNDAETNGVSVADKKISCMWPEMKELDLSHNNIEFVDTVAVEALDLCPLLTVLTLSNNRISRIDDIRTLNSLSILNLQYNQLTEIPPIPPNLKVLILSHNYLSSLNNSQNSSRHLESFITQGGPYRNLEVLDLSFNMIASDTSLRVLRDIASLKHVSLNGNPMSYTPTYRNVVLSNLNKLAINRHFTVDKKRLTSTEVRYAIEQSKKCKYVPQFTSPIAHSPNPMSTSLMSTSQTSASRPSPISHLTSLTQSFESNSSSLRSSRRKKPKIREISTIDFNESYNENISPVGEDNESIVRVPLERSESSSSENTLDQARATIKALRDKYGADNWLLNHHPGRSEVSKIICIPSKPKSSHSLEANNPSRSLPDQSDMRSGRRRNSCSRCEGLSSNNGGESNENKTSSDGISVVTSHKNSSGGGSDVGSYSDSNTNYGRIRRDIPTDKSSSGVTGDEDGRDATSAYSAYNDSASSTVTTSAGGGSHGENVRQSIFDMNTDYSDEKFLENPEKCEYFRVFMQGLYHNLICFNGFLFEVDPTDLSIYNKWDLNSLVSLEEEKCDSETETVEFRLRFNTMRKQMREKSFIMCAKDFSKFDKLVGPYIEKKTIEEFVEALQCTRCHAQFSKAMALKTVKHEKGCAPREVLICPDPTCENEYLVTLDTIPLPNNECLEVDRGSLDINVPVPMRTSTPCSGEKRLGQSVPKGKSPPLFEAIKYLASSLTSRKSFGGNESPVSKPDSSLEDRSDCASEAKTHATTSSDIVANTRSDSDIEVLSYESSSIEVLNKCGDSESDDIDVPEAEEVPVPEFQATKSSKGPMSESTSSGSCSESIVTQYERRMQPISQPLLSPSFPSSNSTTSSTCASLNSFASSSTLTSGILSSPNKAAFSSTIPICYDYVNFAKVDHRLQLWSELSVFKSVDENLMAVIKCMVITDAGNMLGLVIFSSVKIYLYKIVGVEGDKPQEWLSRATSYDISKFTRLDVLIGRHGVGVDLSGKYFAMIFRDSERTSSFLEYFMSEICGILESPPMVRDLSQTQKALMCPTSPLAYFGIVRFAICDIEYCYPVSAIVLTQEDMILITDLSWMVTKSHDTVIAKHCKPLASIRQIESLESDPTLVKLICDTTKWELLFETYREKESFLSALRTDLNVSVSSITICSPIEA